MGDLITDTLSGELSYFKRNNFLKIKRSMINDEAKASLISDMQRINILYMISKAGSGHIGTSFSSIDIMTWLYFFHMKKNDIFFSSKGHDSPAVYNSLIVRGDIKEENIHHLRKIDGLPGHPDTKTPGIITNTGSLGMGISKAKGMILADRAKGIKRYYYVLLGDGELQEGQIWESLVSAVNNEFKELVVIVDNNKIQSDKFVKDTSNLLNLKNKFMSFGWKVKKINGNNFNSLRKTFTKNFLNSKKPKIIIADTIKGYGAKNMDHRNVMKEYNYYPFHSGAPSKENYDIAKNEILKRIKRNINQCKDKKLSINITTMDIQKENIQLQNKESLINKYSKLILNEVKKNKKIMCLDADLVLDTGLIPVKENYPQQFFECGISEQDMVSMAGGLAIMKQLPVVHSFSCFLCSRAAEQIYNNSTENNKVIYVGSLAGVLPGGPGHSHQSVKDISLMSSNPDLIVYEPSCEKDLHDNLPFLFNKVKESVYIRLCSLQYSNLSKFPFLSKKPKVGVGNVIKNGQKIAIITYGPIMTNAAIKVANNLSKTHKLKVINMPWLNKIDSNWLSRVLSNVDKLICIDNHYDVGGLADRLARIILDKKMSIDFKSIALNETPKSGTNEEVLSYHGLDIKAIENLVVNT